MEDKRDWHHGGTRGGMEKEREDGCEGVERRDGGLGRRTGGLATDSPEASPSERVIQDHHHEPRAHKARTPRKVFGSFWVFLLGFVFVFLITGSEKELRYMRSCLNSL